MIILRDKLFFMDAHGNEIDTKEMMKGIKKLKEGAGGKMTTEKAREIWLRDYNANIVGEAAEKASRRSYLKGNKDFVKNAAKYGGDFERYNIERYGAEKGKQLNENLKRHVADARKTAENAERSIKRLGSGRTPGSVVPGGPASAAANAAEAEKLGFFKRLKNGWNGMSTRNKVLVGGGAAALAAGGAYLAHKRRAKARASMED